MAAEADQCRLAGLTARIASSEEILRQRAGDSNVLGLCNIVGVQISQSIMGKSTQLSGAGSAHGHSSGVGINRVLTKVAGLSSAQMSASGTAPSTRRMEGRSIILDSFDSSIALYRVDRLRHIPIDKNGKKLCTLSGSQHTCYSLLQKQVVQDESLARGGRVGAVRVGGSVFCTDRVNLGSQGSQRTTFFNCPAKNVGYCFGVGGAEETMKE
ncbi:hypothetical protein B0H17DRAFT_1133365 [Mycena rosella]|uniref:Uncharacterized protein n=1 Tax=Mycena rosella TaxID=1033263 RepID=A0AAD7GI84_MYCRO|nr:hypothetical protein B0H17DRAFT_1133365 [Mycena rosella]